jgi:hypothetical protein
MLMKTIVVILNPSPVILNEVKNLYLWLRVNSVKNLKDSVHYKLEILRLTPQNDITTQSFIGAASFTRFHSHFHFPSSHHFFR